MKATHATVTIDQFAEPAYLAYMMKVVTDRAIPSSEDGLKPVQRRILYAMNELKLLPRNAKPVKCARVVGDVIGKYHPHGDTAVYETMVRMAQDFSLRYPLVHGEGNFGSRDGDDPAAMRYTEARLAPIAAALLEELSWDAVDKKPTYDHVLTEPVVLPARLPFLLLNGSSGIAVGLATNLFSHNLREVVEAAKLVLLKPSTDLAAVLAVLPGPDFPSGGRLISTPEEIARSYADGRGALRLRGQWTVEKTGLGNRSWRLAIQELPQDTSTAKIMVAINELMDPTPPEKNGKKQPLTPEQLRLKKMFGELIDAVRDDSDKDHPVRVLIDPKDRKSDPEVLAKALCAHTHLEMNVSPNFVCVDRAGKPRQAGLLEWLQQWCSFRVDTVRRRLQDEKRRVDARLHILSGRLCVLDRLEEVIAVLKHSDRPSQDLMERFGLDAIQADDVLEMRLRQLARLEKDKILLERAGLLTEQARLGHLLADEKSLRKLIVKELDADAKSFGDPRRTQILQDAPVTARKQSQEPSHTALLAPEPVALALTERGWLAWRPAKSLEEAQALDYKIKAGDSVRRIFFGDRADQLLLLDGHGRAYALRLTDLPSKADTLPLTQWFTSSSTFVEGALGGPSHRWVFANSGGYGFIAQGSDWMNRMAAGKAFMRLAPGQHPLPPLPLPAPAHPAGKSAPSPAIPVADPANVIALASDGRAVVFALEEIKALSGGKGVGLMGLAPEVHMADLAAIEPDDTVVLRTAQGKQVKLTNDHWGPLSGGRVAGRKGRLVHKLAPGSVFHRRGREEHALPVSPP